MNNLVRCYQRRSKESALCRCHDKMATSSATRAAIIPFARGDHDDRLFPVSVSGDGAQSHGASIGREAIISCANLIKDTDADIHRRGMAVVALGRTLRHEQGKEKHGGEILSAEYLRKVKFVSTTYSYSRRKLVIGAHILSCLKCLRRGSTQS